MLKLPRRQFLRLAAGAAALPVLPCVAGRQQCVNGYVLGIGTTGTHILNGAVYPLTYDVVKDFEPITLEAVSVSEGSRGQSHR
jgi:hypothetical protein